MERMNESPTNPVSWWPAIVACGVAAAVINFGHFHHRHHGDTIIPALISLFHWTPFVWEQSRMGMLLPLVATPISHPLGNLLTQTMLASFLSLSVFFLLMRYLSRDRVGLLVGSLGAIGFLAVITGKFRFDILAGAVTTFYALALVFAGLILIDRRGWASSVAGFGLVMAGHWVNHSLGLFLLPLVAARGVLLPSEDAERSRRPLVLPMSLLMLATGLGTWMTKFAPTQDTPIEFLPIGDWPRTWLEVARNATTIVRTEQSAIFVALVVAGMIASVRWGNAVGRRQAVRIAAVLMTASVVSFVATCSLSWIPRNDYSARYVLSSILGLQMALVVMAVWPWAATVTWPTTHRSTTVAMAGIIVAALIGYGRPSWRGVNADIDRAAGRLTRDLIEARCTHVAGDFWDVWPAVFHAHLRGRDPDSRLWGIAHRCQETRPLWLAMPPESMRIAVPRFPGNPDAAAERLDWALRTYCPPEWKLLPLEERDTIRVYSPVPPTR